MRGDEEMTEQCTSDNLTVDEWLAARKEEALKINPATAEVDWNWGQILDPYNTDRDLPPECRCVGRLYFARAPDSEIRVSFYDLPQSTRDALWDRIDRGLVRFLTEDEDIEML
jgi:hypothetical protein